MTPHAFQLLIINAMSNDGNNTALINVLQCIVQRQFYIECIPCLNGQFAFGSTEIDGEDIPYIHTTPASAFADLAEEKQRYKEEIESGDREPDDEYEGQVAVLKWDGGDNISILEFGPFPSVWIENESWRWHAGIEDSAAA
ncbi:hypothetical protein V5298_00315 [Alteromonas sp. 14N.309.X.WAT.G.H12]